MPGQEIIRVFIVDDNAETRENVRRLLQFDPSFEIIATARSGKEAIELSSQISPDVIIMDINMPDMDGITATENIRKILPFAQTIILSIQNDPSYLRKAMLVGASDYLTKPPPLDDLIAAVRRAGTIAQDQRKKFSRPAAPTIDLSKQISSSSTGPVGNIIVVYSPKGGVGCTTIATNLALALHSETSPVVLVDGNIQFGDVAVFLNEQVKNSILDLSSRVDELEPDFIREVMIKNKQSGVHILPAPPRPEMAENVKSEQFGKLIHFLRQMYSFIVVDTSSYLTDVVQTALEHADIIILVTNQDIPAIRDCNLFLLLADSSGINRNQILFVMNQYDKRIAVTPEKVGESLRQPVVESIPFDDKNVGNSIIRGVPFVIDNKGSLVSKSIFNIAGLIQQKISENTNPSGKLIRK